MHKPPVWNLPGGFKLQVPGKRHDKLHLHADGNCELWRSLGVVWGCSLPLLLNLLRDQRVIQEKKARKLIHLCAALVWVWVDRLSLGSFALQRHHVSVSWSKMLANQTPGAFCSDGIMCVNVVGGVQVVLLMFIMETFPPRSADTNGSSSGPRGDFTPWTRRRWRATGRQQFSFLHRWAPTGHSGWLPWCIYGWMEG